MRRPAGWLVTAPPGGVRQHRPSATTSGTCERTNARPRAPLMCNAQSSRQGGSEPKKRRGGAPRGEHPRRADCVSGSARDARRDASRLRAYVTGSRKGAAAPERLSALRFPRSRVGTIAKLGGFCLARTMKRAHAISVTLRRERSEPRRATARVRWRPVAVVLRGPPSAGTSG